MWGRTWLIGTGIDVVRLNRNQPLGYGVAVVVIGAATAVLKIFGGHINPTTVALSFLLIVLFLALAWGSKPAVIASLLAVACFNYFFLPPIGTFTIADPHNWIALLAFLITAVIVGQLSARTKRQADEAEASRIEIETLYRELKETFEQASEAQALKQSEQLKSALLDAVTHDLRTPLTSIKASVTTLLDDEQSSQTGTTVSRLDEEGRTEMLQVIDEETDRLDRFIEGLMELARIDAGELKLRRQWTPLEEIVTTALKRAEPRTRQHRIELSLPQGLPSIKVDEKALEEVFYALVDNAAKYSPVGSIIRISAKIGSDETLYIASDETLHIAVEDQGPGIPNELHERVFNKFFRVNHTDGGQLPGTGLGLAIAKGIVEAHGGHIWIEDSQTRRGTKVVVRLPTEDDVNHAR